MKKIQFIGLLSLFLMLSSCLKKDLPEYENWDLNNIDNVYVEYRYEGSKIMNGKPVVEYQRMTVQKTVNTTTNTIELSIEVPAAAGSFTQEVRNKVSQNYLWVYTDISTAAKIASVGDTPKLGDPADLSKELRYQVTAANGTPKTWIIKTTSFKK